MRLSLYESVPTLPEIPADIPALDLPSSSAIPQPPPLTEGELTALHAWAAKHGFVLMNARDVELAECVWRQTLK
jgi:hypothetical protein